LYKKTPSPDNLPFKTKLCDWDMNRLFEKYSKSFASVTLLLEVLSCINMFMFKGKKLTLTWYQCKREWKMCLYHYLYCNDALHSSNQVTKDGWTTGG
jgi:hypothetical protein